MHVYRKEQMSVLTDLMDNFGCSDCHFSSAPCQTWPNRLFAACATWLQTLAALTEDYPPAAREALSEARRLESDAETGTQRFATFLADQIGARSVTPRAGDAPDAILSRAEAALRDGDLQQALTELEALPDEAKAPLSDWMARAQTRVAAVSAADGLAQELNKE